MFKFIQNFAISFFALLLSLVIFEAAFRLRPAKSVATRSDRPRFYYIHEDARSLNDHRYLSPKPQNVFRIAVVGDSISFGPAMNADDTFAAKLERMLNLNQVALRAEVINYGVPGFSTEKEINLVKQAILDQADLILLQITLNDPEKEILRGGGKHKFGEFSPPPSLRRLFRVWRSAGFVAERLHNTASRREYKKYFFDLFQNPETWNLFQDSARTIVDLARKKQVPLVPVIFPLFGFPLNAEYPFAPLHRQISKFFNGLGIDCLDLFSVYRNIPIERLQVIPGADLHPNEIAHRLAGESIYHALAARRLLPEELKIRKRYSRRQDPREKLRISASERHKPGRVDPEVSAGPDQDHTRAF